MSVTLFIDGNFLGHRARHTTGGLQYEGMPTGVLFAFVRDLAMMTDLHQATRVVIAFDTAGSLRKKANTHYKSSRVYTEEQEEEMHRFFEEMKRLRKEILPELGYRNIWRERGYEADDLIAAGCAALEPPNEGVIVTADNDLWQCVRPNVRWWNPITKRTVTYESFLQEWGIEPWQWAIVKAIAGCKGDDVVGVSGVGEKTAAQWVRRDLNPDSVKYKAIESARELARSNMKLVRLPFEGLEVPSILEDEVTESKRRRVMEMLGIRPTRRSLPPGRMPKGFI
jgi:DNA polymerase-1